MLNNGEHSERDVAEVCAICGKSFDVVGIELPEIALSSIANHLNQVELVFAEQAIETGVEGLLPFLLLPLEDSCHGTQEREEEPTGGASLGVRSVCEPLDIDVRLEPYENAV